jgi:tetratricopeptide (TPR) repeat protein
MTGSTPHGSTPWVQQRRPVLLTGRRKKRRREAVASLLPFALTVLLAFAPLAASAQAGDPNRAVAVAKKLELLQRYLQSGNADKIATGDNSVAQELLDRAQERAGEALQSYNRGDMAIAEERLNEAFRAYTEALDAQRAKRAGLGEMRQQNADLRKEVVSYLQAFDEALLAKGPAAAGLLNRGRVDDLLDESRYLEENGDPQAAQLRLKEVYNLAVTALSRIRENETVVYALDFRTPADEYRYELNRFQSYSMLVTQMRKSSELGTQALKLAKRYAEEGTGLRKEAEEQAGAGQYERAIATMEQANKRLVRSLQMMGLSIPG